MNQQALSAFIWGTVTDLLRGDYKQSKYGRVILPLTVLRGLVRIWPQITSRNLIPRSCALRGNVF